MQLQERVKCSTLSHVSAALLNDLSKAFDCIDHKPLITKMDAVGFDSLSLNFLSFYLKKRNQRTKLNSFYNSWADILFDLRQDSILRPRLFTQSKIPQLCENYAKLCKNCAFPQNFHTKKLGEITIFYALLIFTYLTFFVK